jgi:heat shock protein HslJ
MDASGSHPSGPLPRRRLLAGLGLAAVGLAAPELGTWPRSNQGASAPADTPERTTVLGSTPWQLVSYALPDGSPRPVLPSTEITADFQAGRVTGRSGCNDYSADYGVTGRVLVVSGLSVSLVKCGSPPGIMQQEMAYPAALRRVAQVDVTPHALTLRDRTGGLLLSYVPQPQTPLEGTRWAARYYNDGHSMVPLITGTTMTARLSKGRLTGSAGCHQYTALYTLNGNAIRIDSVISTRLACLTAPGALKQEADYLASIEKAHSYRIVGRELTLRMADGAQVASYVPVDAG